MTTSTTAPPTGLAPGLYDGLDINAYHRDPSLSSSGARRLLLPGCPALYRWEQDNPRPPKAEYDFGHLAHALVLGDGPEIVVVNAKDWTTKAAQTKRDKARAGGAVPVLTHDYERAQAMAAAIREHPIASRLFAPGSGRPEQSLFWRDPATGVMLRARPDWLPNPPATGRLIVPDYKTANAVDPESVAKAIQAYGYHQQADWYETGCREVLGVADVALVLVLQMKTPPYLVHVTEPDPVARRIAAAKNKAAIDLYARCLETGTWPGYGDDDITLTQLPLWAEKNDTEEYL